MSISRVQLDSLVYSAVMCSATKLRPLDARMWCAMGQCYENEQLGMDAAAIRCYRRALVNQDREGIALHKLVLRKLSDCTGSIHLCTNVSYHPHSAPPQPGTLRQLRRLCRPSCTKGVANEVRQRITSG